MASGTMRQAMAASACCALRRAPTRRCCATAAVAPNSVPPMLLTMVAEQPRGARGFAAGGVAERQHGRACVVGVRPGGRDLLQPMQCVSGASAGRRTPAPCMWVRASSSDAGAGDGDGDGRGSGGRRPRRRRAQGVRVAHSAQQKGFPTPKTVYCSYLPYEWREDELMAFGAQCGHVPVNALAHVRANGRPTGTGLIAFETSDGAAAAAEKLHDFVVGERRISVIRRRQDGAGVLLSNLPHAMAFSDVRDVCRVVGYIDRSWFVSKDTAMVIVKEDCAAELVDTLVGGMLQGQRLKVTPVAPEDDAVLGWRYDPEAPSEASTVVVHNLPPNTHWKPLSKLFERCGMVSHTRMITPQTALVRMAHPEMAMAAVSQLMGYQIGGHDGIVVVPLGRLATEMRWEGDLHIL